MCVFVWETHKGVTLSWFLLLASGSETHTAAGAAEHSLQRNDQVSDAAQQKGAGMASYSGLVALQLLSHPIKSRFTTLQMAWDWPSNPEARGREGSLTKPDINISWADYTRCWKTSTNNQISSRQINQRDIFHDPKPFNNCLNSSFQIQNETWFCSCTETGQQTDSNLDVFLYITYLRICKNQW